MKVYDYNISGASTTGTTRTSETSGSDRASNSSLRTSKGEGDRVELSSTLHQLSRALASYGEERTSAVQALTSEYQTGSYRADAVATGRAIVADALAADR